MKPRKGRQTRLDDEPDPSQDRRAQAVEFDPHTLVPELAQTDEARRLWTQIVDAYHEPLRGFLAWLSGDADLADDIMQHVWITAVRTMWKIREPKAAYSWLKRVGIRALNRHHANESKRNEVLGRYQNSLGDTGPHQDGIVDEALAPTEVLRRTGISVREWERRLDGLSVEDLRLFTLLEADGRTHADVAAILGISVSASKQRLHRIKRRLRGEH